MIGDLVSQRNMFVENNKYENASTLPRIALTTTVIAPAIDSIAINAYSHGGWTKFGRAMNTGIYNNHTFMGGSFFGEAYGKMFKLKDGASPFGGIGKMIRGDGQNRFSMNFISKKYMEAKEGFNMAADVGENFIETGLGISRNHKDFFNLMKNHGFEKFSEISVNKTTVRKVKSSGGKMLKNTNKVINKVDKYQVSNSVKQEFFENFVEHYKPEQTKEIFNKFFGTMDSSSIVSFQQSLNNAGFKTTLNTVEELGTKEALEKAAGELSETVYKSYFKKTVAQEIMGHPATMLLTGAGNIGGKLGTFLNIGGAVMGSMTNMHQESMIQSNMNLGNFQHIRGENTLNDTVIESTYSNARRSMSNEQDLNYVLRASNNAEQYRRDIDPIDIDRTASKLENFTLY